MERRRVSVGSISVRKRHIMHPNENLPTTGASQNVSRRHFIAGTSAAALGFTVLKPELVGGAEANSKINIGLIGCGGRGKWIADLFMKNGNYNLVAVADYFQDRADEAGTKFNVPAAQRFIGLSGYRKLLEQKLDAVVIQTPPYFHPQQAADAVSAGKHVYCAKPIAVDVPGCLSVDETGKRATAKKLCFVVDFQTRAHASYQEAVRRVKAGMIGKLVSGEATYICGPTFTGIAPVLRKDPTNPEVQLRTWGLNRILSGDVITEQNIHALDVACWIIGANPIKAVGGGGEARGLGGTCWDHFSITYWFPNNILLSFSSKQYGHAWDDICCRMYGTKGTIDTHYFGTVSVKSDEDGYNGGRMTNLYADGAINNIATFCESIRKGNYSNPTVNESVRSNLTTILGRTAAYKGSEVTWSSLMKANEKWEFDLAALKA
jgi:myo-inositol 2-dehydrogenase / D-chiro-inositol 1-dehydrogenase